MANKNEMTMREFLNAVIAIEGVSENLVTFAEKEIAKMDEKNAKRKEKLTPNQEANEAIKAQFLATATAGETYTAAGVAETFGIKVQKASAILGALAKAGKLNKIEDYKAEGAKSKCIGYTLA